MNRNNYLEIRILYKKYEMNSGYSSDVDEELDTAKIMIKLHTKKACYKRRLTSTYYKRNGIKYYPIQKEYCYVARPTIIPESLDCLVPGA